MVMNTNCTSDSQGDSYQYLSSIPSHSIIVPVAPTGSVYSVSALFSGLGCTGALVNSSIVLQNGASVWSSSYYYYTYQPQSSSCTAPANGICSGYTFNACPSAGLTFGTIPTQKPSTNWNKVLFRNNVCRKYGGTVFSVKDLQSTTELFGPHLTYYNERVVFDNNIAAVGKEVATQTTSLRSTSNHSNILVTDYNIFLRPSLMFSLVDDFNNVNTTDFSTTVSQALLLYLPHISSNHLFPSFNPFVNKLGHCDGTELPLWYWTKSFRIFEWCNDCGSSCGCSDI